MNKSEIVYPVILGAAVFAGLHFVFSVRRNPALAVAGVAAVGAFFTIRALQHPPGN